MSARALIEARRMLAHGVCPVPIPHGQKFPAIEWKRFQLAKPAELELERLFGGETGIGVVCGAVSGNLAVLDFDNTDAYHFWWNATGRNLAGVVVDRRGARFHVYVRLTEPTPSGKLFVRGFEGPAGDLLSEGKLCVIPPTVHPNGTPREWLFEPRHGFATVRFEELGVYLREAPRIAFSDDTGDRAAASDRPGDVFNARATWAEVLEPHGWRYAGRCGAYHGWTRPGKPSGVSAASGLGSRGQDLLYVFTSNAEPLQADTCYSKFAAVAALEHGGDYRAATRALAAAGFGDASSSSLKSAGSDDGGASVLHHPTGNILGDDDAQHRFADLFQSLPAYLEDAGDGEPDWVVENLLPASYLVVLGGNSKAGKSTFMTAVSLSVATGEPFAGLTTCGAPVLWCAFEESRDERAMILREFERRPEGVYLTHAKLYIDSQDGLDALRFWIAKTGARLIVVDPLYGATQAESLNDGRTARQVLAGLKDLCSETGACAVVLHHITKNTGVGMTRERIADSNQILATASMDVLMDVTEEATGERKVRLNGRGRGACANQTWVFGSKGVASWELLAVGSESDVDSEYRDTQLVASVAQEPLTAAAIAERTGLHVGTVRNRLTHLVRVGRLAKVGSEGRAALYGPGADGFTLTVVEGGSETDFKPAS